MVSPLESDSAVGVTGRARMTPGRRVVAIALTVLGTLVLGVVGLEVIFRLFVPVIDVPFVFWDPVVGLRRQPDQSGRIIKGKWINSRYHFNAQGWNHEREYVTTKPPGSRRVCVVGDSQVQSYEVDVDKTFFAQAERLMSKAAHPAEWYAFGGSGLGPSQEAGIIRHYALDYRPDLVLLLFVENDPFDSSGYVFPVENSTPAYYLDDHEQLVYLPAHFWQPTWYRRVIAMSALVRYFTVQKDVFHRQSEQAHELGDVYLREGPGKHASLHVIPGLDKMSVDERRAATWRMIEKIFEGVRDECKRRGAQFAIVYRGNSPVFWAALEGRTYTPPPKEVDPYCLTKARLFEMGHEFLEPMCKRLGVPYFDLTEAIRQSVVETRQPHIIVDDGHWSGATHTAVAKALAAWTDTLLSDHGSN